MTIAELQSLLIAQNGQLTEQQAVDFRNSYFNDPLYPTENWYLSLWQINNDIDFFNIQPMFWYVLKKAVIDWLLSDDDDPAEYDVISRQDGDKVERNLRLDNDVPQALKDELLIEIGQLAFRIDSPKLQTAVNTANGV
jgi:hypothetical protein